MSAITWDDIKPGTIVTFLPVENRNARRVLVEKVDDSHSRQADVKWISGVEVSSRFGLRNRRGVIPGEQRPFFVNINEIRGVMQPGATTERLTAQVQRLRAQALATR